MTSPTVTRRRFASGIWEGEVSGTGDRRPAIEVRYGEAAVEGVSLTADEAGRWHLWFPVPADALSDGVHTVLVRCTETGETLDQLIIAAGDGLEEDLRGEVSLLRAELDLLKRAFRRHVRDG